MKARMTNTQLQAQMQARAKPRIQEER